MGIDERAIERLFTQLRPRIVQYLQKRFRPALADDEAEEVVQEGFLRAWDSRERFDPKRGKLEAWFFCICRNVAREWRRRGWVQQRSQETSASPAHLIQFELDDRVAATLGPSSADSPRERLVWQAVAMLSEDEQSILRADAYSAEGKLPNAAHAEELKISKDHAKKLHQRALEHLEKALEALGVTAESVSVLIEFSIPREPPAREK